jgi:Bacterial capsule synthesis protein PGA_cap
MAGPTRATYVRRVAPAAAVLAAVAGGVALWLGLRDGGDGEVAEAPSPVAEDVREPRKPRPVHLTVSASGDLLIHSPVYARALALGGGSRYDFAPMFGPIRPYVARADLALCHVETPMGAGPPQGYPTFNTPIELARAIAATGWDACDTASNHSLDQGAEGIGSTIEALERAGVEHTGSYASNRAQRKPLILKAKGVRIALLAYTTDTNGFPLPEPWSLNVVDGPDPIVDDARRARRAGADAVIVNVHWGADVAPEYVTEVAREQESFARRLAESRHITAVVGQGPHIVQPIRRVGGEAVVFSEGNLVSNQNAGCCAAGAQDGLIAILHLTVRGDRARLDRVRYVPVWVSQPDFTVLPVGDALRGGDGDPTSLRASYQRTVGVAGQGGGIEPVPGKLP